MDTRINIFVLIFVFSIRIKQVILFLWTNVFNCSNDVNISIKVRIAIQYFLIVLVLAIGFHICIYINICMNEGVNVHIRALVLTSM